ncbi:MAG: hypothetical protein V3V40_06490 [Nitrosomonadaceae bacterium]
MTKKLPINNNIRKFLSGFLSSRKPVKESPLLSAALAGHSDIVICNEVVRRLDKEMKEKGADTFTINDIRRIRNGIYGIKNEHSNKN